MDPILSHINAGNSVGCTIRKWGEIMNKAAGFEGTTRKPMDVSRLTSLAWQVSIALKQGLNNTCQWLYTESGPHL